MKARGSAGPLIAARYEVGVRYLTDQAGGYRDHRAMDVLVTITVIDDEGGEIADASASAETPEDAFALALQQIELDEDE